MATLLSSEEDVEDLFQRFDCPLQTASDPNENGKKYLLIDHSRDGDSYRSPWSNQYYPPIVSSEDRVAFKPSFELRRVERIANEVFESYCEMYFGKDKGVVSSVYLWDTEDVDGVNDSTNGFAGCFLVSKSIKDEKEKGFWNSIHVVDVGSMIGGKAKFKLTTTVLLSISVFSTEAEGESNKIHINGSLTKGIEETRSVKRSSEESDDKIGYILNIGEMIEEIESEMRSTLHSLYVQKTREIVDSMHCNSNDRKSSSLMAAMMAGNGFQQQSKIQAAMTARSLRKKIDS